MSNAKNENPGALAGATGAELLSDDNLHIPYTTASKVAANGIRAALANVSRAEALLLLEEDYHVRRPGQPIATFKGLMEEAAFWADMASPSELKAYMLACYNRLSRGERRAFLNYVQEEGRA